MAYLKTTTIGGKLNVIGTLETDALTMGSTTVTGITSATTDTGAKLATAKFVVDYITTNTGTIDYNTSGGTATETIPRGKQIKIGAGYYPNDLYYNAEGAPTLSGNATAAQVLSGKTFYSNSYTKQTGTMTDNGATGGTITTQGGTYTIPAGYTSGGTVTANISAGSVSPVGMSTGSSNTTGIYIDKNAGYIADGNTYITGVTVPKDKVFSVTMTADTAADTTSNLTITNAAHRTISINGGGDKGVKINGANGKTAIVDGTTVTNANGDLTTTSRSASTGHVTLAAGAGSVSVSGSNVTLSDTDNGIKITAIGSGTVTGTGYGKVSTGTGWITSGTTQSNTSETSSATSREAKAEKFISAITVPASKTLNSVSLIGGPDGEHRTYINTISVPGYTTINSIAVSGIIEEITCSSGILRNIILTGSNGITTLTNSATITTLNTTATSSKAAYISTLKLDGYSGTYRAYITTLNLSDQYTYIGTLSGSGSITNYSCTGTISRMTGSRTIGNLGSNIANASGSITITYNGGSNESYKTSPGIITVTNNGTGDGSTKFNSGTVNVADNTFGTVNVWNIGGGDKGVQVTNHTVKVDGTTVTDDSGDLITTFITPSASLANLSSAGDSATNVTSRYFKVTPDYEADQLGWLTTTSGNGTVKNYTVRAASDYSLSVTNQGSTTVTVGSENTNSAGSGYYPLTTSLTGTLSASTTGWFSSGSATDSSVVVGRIAKGTITNNTSGGSSTATINRGKQIKIGAGYYPNDLYYTASTAIPDGYFQPSGTYTASSAVTNEDISSYEYLTIPSATLTLSAHARGTVHEFTVNDNGILTGYGEITGEATSDDFSPGWIASAPAVATYTNTSATFDGSIPTTSVTPSASLETLSSAGSSPTNVASRYFKVTPSYSATQKGWLATTSGSGTVQNYIIRAASGISIGDQGQYIVTVGNENTSSSGSGYYPLTQTQLNVTASTPGWFSSGTDSSVVVGKIKKGTITNNTSGGTSSGTITAGQQIKISQGYYKSDLYYTAQTATATPTNSYAMCFAGEPGNSDTAESALNGGTQSLNIGTSGIVAITVISSSSYTSSITVTSGSSGYVNAVYCSSDVLGSDTKVKTYLYSVVPSTGSTTFKVTVNGSYCYFKVTRSGSSSGGE